jgi:hypothetical protein
MNWNFVPGEQWWTVHIKCNFIFLCDFVIFTEPKIKHISLWKFTRWWCTTLRTTRYFFWNFWNVKIRIFETFKKKKQWNSLESELHLKFLLNTSHIFWISLCNVRGNALIPIHSRRKMYINQNILHMPSYQKLLAHCSSSGSFGMHQMQDFFMTGNPRHL